MSIVTIQAQILERQVDTLDQSTNTVRTDNVDVRFDPTANIRNSNTGLEAEAKYGARDSMFFDNSTRRWHLWGDAFVEYLSMSVIADYIVFDVDSNIAMAQGLADSSGTVTGYPVFTQEANTFEAKRLRYNFQTQKGKVYEAITTQGDLYILGDNTKFIGATGDSARQNDYVYNEGALITSCNHPEPHYGIRSKRIKTIPNRLAVIGPSNVEIMGVPTPLWLPFGFFPVTSSRKAGLIFPQDYEYSEAWGYGLRGIGYYLPLGEYIDARVLGDIYFNGSWGATLQSNYVKRYKYRGSFNLGYSVRKSQNSGELQPSVRRAFSLQISHSQDANAHPYNTFGGSISIQSNGFQSLNNNDANSVLTNTYSSNFSWQRQFPNKPYRMSLGMSHSQNTRTHAVSINAPEFEFRLNRIYPFKRRRPVGGEKWYERIGMQYTGRSRTVFTTTDTTIFTQQTLDDVRSGVQHVANADMAFSLGNYLHFTPQINYEEIWYFQTLEKEFVFDPEEEIVFDTLLGPAGEVIIVPDTLSYGSTQDNFNFDFKPYRRFSTGISLSTQLFATWQKRKGLLRGLRHVLKPSISYSYTPATDSSVYQAFVRDDIRDPESMEEYSVFQGGVYPARITRQDQSLLSYSFNNIFEAKYYSKKDSTEKKLKLFNNIIVGGSYNFAADSLHFSQLSVNGTTRLLKGATTFSFSSMFDPYTIDAETGRRINRYYWDDQKKLLRFDRMQLRLNTRLTPRKIREIFSGEDSPGDGSRSSGGRSRGGGQNQRQGQNSGPDRFVDLFDGFNINHNFSMTRIGREGRDTTVINTHTVNIQGNMRLTPKWSISIGNIGYDFRAKRLSYPDIGFVRDLHCWQMRFSWQPQRGTYTLQIGVKPGSLEFLKLPHQRNNQNADTFGGF